MLKIIALNIVVKKNNMKVIEQALREKNDVT